MVDVNETQENPVIESETQAAPEGEEVYEYEYVELEEGQELPEGYEYEYVEVDENGNPIETGETGISTEDDVQLPEAGQGEVSLDALLEKEPEEAAVPIVPVFDDEAEVWPTTRINPDDLQLEDIQISEEIETPDVSAAELVNNTNDKSVFVEPEGIVFQNDDNEAAGKVWHEEIKPQPAAEESVDTVEEIVEETPDTEEIIAAEEPVVEEMQVVETEAVAEETAEEIFPEAEEVIDDEELLSPAEGETSLDQLLDEETEEVSVAAEETVAEKVAAGAISEPAEEILTDVVSQEVDDKLIETLGDVVIPSADEISGGIPPIENSVMEEMIADGATVSMEEIPDSSEPDTAVEETSETTLPEPLVHEEMLAGVLDAVSENISEEVSAEDAAVEAEENVAPVFVEEVVEESSVMPEAESVIEEKAAEELVAPAFSEVETVLSESDELEEEVLIPQTNVADNIFVDEELELPPELPLVADAAGAEMLLVGNREVEQLSINTDDVRPEIEMAETPVLEELAAKAYPVGKNDGVRSLTMDEDGNILLLNDLDFENNELRFWNMVLFNQHILPLKAPVNNVSLPLEHGVNRRITLIRNGVQKIKLFNEDNIKIINATNACAKVEGRFICGDLGDNSGLVVDDCLTIPLADMYGKVISFASPVSGFLSGPNGALIYFSELAKLVIPNNEKIKADADKLQYRISKWYSGTANDKYFEFSANSESAVFEGNDEMKAIHVNVNNSSYGWNVSFDNGLSMNLRDLREYQTRFGKMPSPNGVISYGKKTLAFSNVERIVVYESVQYFYYS